MRKIIYLTGLPRSMTTLMANVLANNPNITGGETSPLLEYIYAARANYTNTPEVKSALSQDKMYSSFIAFCKYGMQGYAEEMCGMRPILLDKSRGWVHYAPFLWEIQPDAKIILMVRDIRSVLSSLEKKWRQNPSILDSRDNPGQQKFITIEQRVAAWLNDPPLGIALKRIYNAIQTATIKNMLVVKAENFCNRPGDVMKEVYSFIEEPYCEVDYSNVEQKTIENDRISDFGIYGDHTIRNNIKPLDRDYNEILGKNIAIQVRNEYSWFYDYFKYS